MLGAAQRQDAMHCYEVLCDGMRWDIWQTAEGLKEERKEGRKVRLHWNVRIELPMESHEIGIKDPRNSLVD